MKTKVLITGSSGLIGSALTSYLIANGIEVLELDIADKENPRDVLDRDTVDGLISQCTGVVHLAAISRVVWGEENPELCRHVNLGGTRNILDAAKSQTNKPWVLFGSSREVYGQAPRMPVSEDDELNVINVYGQTKAEGEKMTLAAREEGLRTAVVRFSNVYGRCSDHVTRVTPAFARAAVEGTEIRVDGSSHTFDFVHLDDVLPALLRLIQLLEDGHTTLPPIHLASGRATTLGELAEWTVECSGGRCTIREAPERDYDVGKFIGNPSRARELLDWEAKIIAKEGFKKLVEDFRIMLKKEPL